jgi:glycosyltransferase involved in cell wall biosynthesis
MRELAQGPNSIEAATTMHVLNVNMSIDPVLGGGTAERTVKMSKFLARSGVRSTILTIANGAAPPASRHAGTKVIEWPCWLDRFYVPKPNHTELCRLLNQVDIVHLMNHWTGINAWVWMAARRARRPYVFCPAGALPIVGRSRLVKSVYNHLIGYRIARKANRCIAISRNEIHHFNRYGVPENSISVIPNGVDPDDFKHRDDALFREKYGLGNQPFLLFMGRLNRIKGPDLLLHAFSRISRQFERVKLVIAGPDGGLQSELIRLVKDLGLSAKVCFTGYIGGEDKSRAYHAAEILVIPSRQEAMSLVVLEAGVCKTPVVLTDKCGFDAVAAIDGGKVVSASAAGLCKGVTELLSRPAELQEAGARLRDFVISRFTWAAIAEQLIALYERILSGRPQRS